MAPGPSRPHPRATRWRLEYSHSSAPEVILAAEKGIGALSFSFVEPAEAKRWVDDYYETLFSSTRPQGGSGVRDASGDEGLKRRRAATAVAGCLRDRERSVTNFLQDPSPIFRWAEA